MKTMMTAAILTLAACTGAPALSNAANGNQAATTATQDAEPRRPDVIYVPTPPEVVEAMLDMADVKDGDVLYDLGSGDGRIPIAAVKRANLKKAVGIDIDPTRIQEANDNARMQGVTGKVQFRQADLFASDFSDATVITLYLLDSLNEKLRPKLLAELKPGTRIVSHAFRMGDWEPDESKMVGSSMIYSWTVPARGDAAPTGK